MVKWPDNDEPMEFEKLTAPLVRAVRFAYDLKRKNRDKDIPWRGPSIGKDCLATCFDAKEQLTASNLQYSEDEQGRDALVEIIGLALRLGIEQGRRITMESSEVRTLRLFEKIARMKIDNIENGEV